MKPFIFQDTNQNILRISALCTSGQKFFKYFSLYFENYSLWLNLTFKLDPFKALTLENIINHLFIHGFNLYFHHRGEDDRERLESSRSNEDQRDKTDEDKRSRASSTSDKFPAASPSPIHGRRRGSVTPGSVPAASPSSQRVSRSSMTSSSRSSTSTKPSSPPHVTTVIAVESSNAGNGNPAAGGKSQTTSTGNGKDLQEATTTSIEAVGAPTNTHIIKVSGPVTNLDETVTSATEVPPSPPPSPTSGPEIKPETETTSSRSSSPKVIQTSVWVPCP